MAFCVLAEVACGLTSVAVFGQDGGDVIWATTSPNASNYGYRPDTPVAVVASSTRVFSVGTYACNTHAGGRYFGVTMYSPGSPASPETLIWPQNVPSDWKQRSVTAATFCEAQNSVLITGDVPTSSGGTRIATICVGLNSDQTKPELKWSRTEDTSSVNEYSGAITADANLVAIAGVAEAGSSTDVVLYCYNISDGSVAISGAPRVTWSGGTNSTDKAVGISLLPCNGGTAMVAGGTSDFGGSATKLFLAAFQAKYDSGYPLSGWSNYLGYDTSYSLASGYCDTAYAQATTPVSAQGAAAFCAIAGMRGQPGTASSRDFVTLAGQMSTANSSVASSVAAVWQTVWDNPLDEGASDSPTAINVYDAVGSLDTRSSFRVVVTGTSRVGSADSDVETLAMLGSNGTPEWYDVRNNDFDSVPSGYQAEDYPTALSSVTVGVTDETTRQICIAGGTIKQISGGALNTDIWALSYNGVNETGTLPVRRTPLWTKPAILTWPAGDNLDVGVGVVVRNMDASPPPSQFRALFVVGRYAHTSLADEWGTLRLRTR